MNQSDDPAGKSGHSGEQTATDHRDAVEDSETARAGGRATNSNDDPIDRRTVLGVIGTGSIALLAGCTGEEGETETGEDDDGNDDNGGDGNGGNGNDDNGGNGNGSDGNGGDGNGGDEDDDEECVKQEPEVHQTAEFMALEEELGEEIHVERQRYAENKADAHHFEMSEYATVRGPLAWARIDEESRGIRYELEVLDGLETALPPHVMEGLGDRRLFVTADETGVNYTTVATDSDMEVLQDAVMEFSADAGELVSTGYQFGDDAGDGGEWTVVDDQGTFFTIAAAAPGASPNEVQVSDFDGDCLKAAIDCAVAMIAKGACVWSCIAAPTGVGLVICIVCVSTANYSMISSCVTAVEECL